MEDNEVIWDKSSRSHRNGSSCCTGMFLVRHGSSGQSCDRGGGGGGGGGSGAEVTGGCS